MFFGYEYRDEKPFDSAKECITHFDGEPKLSYSEKDWLIEEEIPVIVYKHEEDYSSHRYKVLAGLVEAEPELDQELLEFKQEIDAKFKKLTQKLQKKKLG